MKTIEHYIAMFKSTETVGRLLLAEAIHVARFGPSLERNRDEIGNIAREIEREEMESAEALALLRDCARIPLSGMLRHLRARVGLSQSELAERTGIPQGRISEFETDVREPSVSSLKRLAEVLGPITIHPAQADQP